MGVHGVEMKENMQKLTEEEMRSLLPEIQTEKELIGYEVTEESGKRVLAAIFFASALQPTEGVLGYLYTDLHEEQEKLVGRFFSTCEKDLKKKGIQTLYCKNIGSYEELDASYRTLELGGYEVKVVMGDYLTCKGKEAQSLSAVAAQQEEDAIPDLTSMMTPLSDRQFAVWDLLIDQSDVIRFANYTPACSFLYAIDEENGGMICMNDAVDKLVLTGLSIHAKDQTTHDQILQSLLRAVLKTAANDLPPEHELRFCFENKHDYALADKLLESRGSALHFQEFYKEL